MNTSKGTASADAGHVEAARSNGTSPPLTVALFAVYTNPRGDRELLPVVGLEPDGDRALVLNRRGRTVPMTKAAPVGASGALCYFHACVPAGEVSA